MLERRRRNGDLRLGRFCTMERALPCGLSLLLLFLLGGTAGESGGGTCRLGPYGAPLPDDPLQCPGRLDGSGESSSEAAPASPEGPVEARAGDPPAKETGRSWPLISGVSAEEVSRSPAGPKGAGIFRMEGEQCHKWVHGQASPIESFQCPTQRSHREDLFCCGTCTISYCCSSPKRRLEQESCPKIMEELGDQGAGESTGPPPEKPATIMKTGFVLLVSGFMYLCIWISCFLSYDLWIIYNDQRAGNGQQDVVCELHDRSAVGHPVSGPVVSENPGPPFLVAQEAPRSAKRPPAVASPPDGSGSPMVEMAVLPAVPPEGNLELPAEEEETAV